jgi:acetyl esterase
MADTISSHRTVRDPDPKATALDPVLQQLLPRLNAAAPPVGEGASAGELRTGFDTLIALLAPDAGETPFDGRIVDKEIESHGVRIPTRTWIPAVVETSGTSDTVVFFHGGGWVLGDLASAAPTARAIAERMGLRVLAAQYRLAPEHPFPAAFDDCVAVLRAVRDEGSGWLAVAGDSAGGNLAAAVALAARDEGLSLDAQLLFYPALVPAMDSPSHARYGEGYLLTSQAMRYYWASYGGGHRPADDWRFAPASAGSLAGVAPAVVTTAGFDPLRDEGDDYAARLMAEGVPTLVLPQPGLIHGWIDQAARVPAARQALDEAIDALRSLRDGAVLEERES